MDIKNKHIAKLLLTEFKEVKKYKSVENKNPAYYGKYYEYEYVMWEDIEKIINDVFGDDNDD